MQAQKKLIFLGTILFLSFLFSGCSGFKIDSIRNVAQTPISSPTSGNQMQVSPDGFTPKEVIVSLGETITFTNIDSVAHTIASDQYPTNDELPDLYSPVLYKDQQYVYTFKTAGQFGVHLEDNPSVLAKITVKKDGTP